MFAFRYRVGLAGKWAKARYRAENNVIGAFETEWGAERDFH
jgi:hypothetical protein